jgi:uncharacterized damage-inducible protein DinB
MTFTAPSVARHEPLEPQGERAALQGWLDYHRSTLLHKCAGLSDAQLKLASVEPSTLTLLGLVRHMTEVERAWFRRRFGRLDVPPLYCSDDDADGDFDNVASADPVVDFEAYRAECVAADEAAAGHDLDETFLTSRQRTLDLRWIYLHMIEEYARHNGHADLLRERIDGVTGD